MRGTELLLHLAAAVATPPSQLLFNFTETRHSWSQSLQISELRLYNANGGVIDVVNTTNPGGTTPNHNQVAMMATDGRIETKWIDVGFRANGFSLLYLEPAGSLPVASCALP